MNDYLSIETMTIFDNRIKKIIDRIKICKLNYEEWISYYNLLLKTLYMQIPTINYYEFATTLIEATVIFKTEEEEKDYNEKLKQLKKNISFAEELSKNSNMDINFGLFNVISLDEAIKELAIAIQKDNDERKIAYKGKDGKDYYDFESLILANKNYMTFKNPIIEKRSNNIIIENNNPIIDKIEKPINKYRR